MKKLYPDLMLCPLNLEDEMKINMEVILPDGREEILIIKQNGDLVSGDDVGFPGQELVKIHDQVVLMDKNTNNPYIDLPGQGKIEITRFYLGHWSGLEFTGEHLLPAAGKKLRDSYKSLAKEWNEWEKEMPWI